MYVTLSLVDSLQAKTFIRPCSHLRRSCEKGNAHHAMWEIRHLVNSFAQFVTCDNNIREMQ